MGRFFATLFFFVLALLSVPSGIVQQSQASEAVDGYQSELISQALRSNGLKVEPTPEGKTIERIVVVPYDVFLEQDPFPGFLNWFHATTVPIVIRRELLFQEGETWSQERVRETGRNLRKYLFVSFGSVIAARGSTPDQVVALIVCKDLWSLRMNFDFAYVGSKFERADFQFAEQNVLGRMKRAVVDLGFNLATGYFGQQYIDPRVLGSRLQFVERADVIWNRSSGVIEGGVANFTLEKPLYSLDTQWGWGTSLQLRKDISRLFSRGEIAEVTSLRTGQSLPYAFHRRLADLSLSLTRSFGQRHNHNASVGYQAFVHDFELPGARAGVSEATVQDVSTAILPRSESAAMLFAGVRYFEADFRELMDIETYGLTEDLRLGPEASAEIRYASRAFGLNSSYLQPILGVSWSGLSHDDIVTGSASFTTRYQPELQGASDWVNGELTLKGRNISPRWSLFRLHTSLQATRRHNNLDRDFSTLGSNNSLRGYPSSFFRGANLWVGNLEVRTLPFVFYTLHVGAATFLDLGDAADHLGDLGAHGSAGFGFRIGIPQFNREVLRIDVGFPFERLSGTDPAYIVVQYGQAF